CYCDKGWNHTHTNDPCDKDIDECKLYPNICKNGGSCSNTNGSYICNCIGQWEGENCTYYNSCRSNPCANQGECAKTGNDTDRTYKCTCQLGYKGKNCTLDVDECSLNTTSICVHGNCSNSIGSYKCTCEIGWTSKSCNKTLNKTTTNTTETTNDSSLAMKETKDGLPIIVGASVGGVTIAVAVVGIYLYKRKRARIASEDIAGDTGRNEKFNIKRISKTDRVAPESTTELNAFNSED
ncbi:neurogenic locus notch homolog protein 1-like, partial [Ruditapes philippinarum]|uniref:neurogenic locus notch homolog protein 1-like n=1 Tax=Ruditapes philippinarum TaxID=129788 RepID=UPI00295A956E